MDPLTLTLPITSTRTALEADRGGRYDVTYHGYDALAAPAVKQLPDGRWFADFADVRGRLAERFEPNADATRWTMTLRKGVLSHAGNELTSDDVVWSYQRSFALRAIGYWRASIMGGIARADGVRALDRSTVEFVIDGANPVLPRFLCYHTTAIIDSTEARKHASGNDPWAGEYLATNLCGFGAFRLGRWDEERLEFLARPDFFLGAPPVRGAVFTVVPTRGERFAQFERGDLNFLPGLQPDEATRLSTTPGVTVVTGRTNHCVIEVDHHRPPFSDPGVREAVARTIPYERIVNEAFQGFAEVQHGIYQPNTPEATNDDWTYAPDLERSRQLVQAAGAAGTEITFLLSSLGHSQEGPAIGALVAEALGQIGLKVRVLTPDRIPAGEVPEFYLRAECSHGIADPHYDLAIDFAPPRGMPGRYFPSRRLTPELRAIRTAPAAAQAGMYRDLQREMLANVDCIPVAGHHYPIAYREELAPWFRSEAYLPFTHFLYSAHRF
jgi:peptide/nickel transport system substrate-binding protein